MAADPGWYPDPQGPGRRWWDGGAWTEYTEDVDGLDFSPARPAAVGAVVPADSGAAASVPLPPPVGVWRGPVDDRPVVRTLADAVRVVLAKYAQFDGRASRAEYWYWALFLGICYVGALVMLLIPFVGLVIGVAFVAGALAVVVPSYAVAVRRLRDAGLHWAWILLVLAPFGGIVLLVLCAQPSRYA